MQFIDAAASAAVWFRLIAAPVPSTGTVARLPSWTVAVCPLAKVAAGGTVAAAAVAVGVAAAATAPEALADGLAEAPRAD